MKYSLSIIIPSYNSVKTIDRCISSVFKSKFKNYEAFFNTVYSSGLLDSLKSVNLDFKNQVIIQRK